MTLAILLSAQGCFRSDGSYTSANPWRFCKSTPLQALGECCTLCPLLVAAGAELHMALLYALSLTAAGIQDQCQACCLEQVVLLNRLLCLYKSTVMRNAHSRLLYCHTALVLLSCA